MSICASCRAPILWGTTAGGKPIPLEPAPVETANLAVSLAGQVRYLMPGDALTPGEWRAVSHFVTCPDASLHRKGS